MSVGDALRRFVGQLATRPAGPSLDLDRFQDPLAKTTEWKPLVSGGASFGTHRLKEIGMHRREMRPMAGAIAFYLVFAVFGAAALLGAGIALVATLVAGRWEGLLAVLFLSLFGAVFGGVGGWLYYSGTKPIVFDLALGYFWTGRQAPPYDFGGAPQDAVPLAQVHALQVVSERCSGSDSSFTSYELNLVLHDGSRRNVVDHGNLEALRADARELATFLVVPLWDGTEP